MDETDVLARYSPSMIHMKFEGRRFIGIECVCNCDGSMLTETEVLAVIEYCQNELETFSQKDRDAYNLSLYQEREAEFQKRCEQSKLQREKNRVDPKCSIYLMKDKIRGFIKIGISKSLSVRLDALKTANPAIELLKSYIGVSSDEKILHGHFKQLGKRVDGEWFSLGNSDLEYIDNYFTSKAA